MSDSLAIQQVNFAAVYTGKRIICEGLFMAIYMLSRHHRNGTRKNCIDTYTNENNPLPYLRFALRLLYLDFWVFIEIRF